MAPFWWWGFERELQPHFAPSCTVLGMQAIIFQGLHSAEEWGMLGYNATNLLLSLRFNVFCCFFSDQFCQFFHCFYGGRTLTVLITSQIFCGVSLKWDLAWFLFSWVDCSVFFWRNTTEVKCHSCYIISRGRTMRVTYHVDVNLNHLDEVVFFMFLHHKVTFPLLFLYCTLWKKVTMHSPHLRSGRSAPCPWK